MRGNLKEIVGIITLLLLIATASAQTISIDSAQLAGDLPFEFSLPVKFSGENITGINFNLTFNPEIVNVLSVSPRVDINSIQSNINNQTGFANVAIVFNESMTADSLPVADITFKAVNYGSTGLNFTFAEFSLPDFNTTQVTAINGTVEIKKEFYFKVEGNARVLWNKSYGNITAVEIVDLNGDGAEDVVFAADGGIHALSGSNGNELWNVSMGSPLLELFILTEDVNGDGRSDVIAVAPHQILVISNSGNVSINYENTSIYFHEAYAVDVDGDNFKEIVAGGWAQVDYNKYYLVVIDSNSKEKWVKSFETWLSVISSKDVRNQKEPPVKVANFGVKGEYKEFNFDFNKDGKGDLLIYTYPGHDETTLLALRGYDGHEIWNKTLNGWLYFNSKVNDASGDGVDDILIGGYGALVLSGADGGILWNSTQTLISECYDYDNDDRCEFLTYDGSNVYMRNSDGAERWNISFGDYRSVSTIRDVVYGRNWSTNEVKVVKFNEYGDVVWTYSNKVQSLGYCSALADLNGDGVEDVIFTGCYEVWTPSLAINGANGQEFWLLAQTVKYIGDFDGDGKGDVFKVTESDYEIYGKAGDGLTGDSLAFIFNVTSSDYFDTFFSYDWFSYRFKTYDLNGDSLKDMLFIIDPGREDSKLYAVVVTQPPQPKPDLTVRIEAPLRVKVNERFQINITVSNIGTSASAQTNLNLYIDDRLVNTFSVSPLNKEASAVFTFQHSFATEGDHTIRAVVDPDKIVDELNEGNNEATLSVTAYKLKPDLVGNLSVFDEFGNQTWILKIHKAGDSWKDDRYSYPFVVLNVSFEIRNLNPNATVEKTFTISGAYKSHSYSIQLDSEQLADLNADGVLYITNTAVVDVSNINEGCYLFNVSVDSSNEVEETNEENNNKTYELCLSKPDLIPLLEIPETLTPGINSFTVGVKNVGRVWANTTKLKVYINGSTSESYERDVPILMPGDLWNTTISHNFSKGTYEVKVVADYYDNEDELSEGNNSVNVTVFSGFREVNVSLLPNVSTARYGDRINLTLHFDTQTPASKIDLKLYYSEGLNFVSSDAMQSVSVTLNGWKWMNGAWFRVVEVGGENLNINGSLILANLAFEVTTDREMIAFFNISGDVYSGNARMLLNSTNATVKIEKYTDVYPYIWGYPWQAVDEGFSFKVTVSNLRGTWTEKLRLEVEVFNESERYWNESVEIPPLPPWGYNITEYSIINPPAGTYRIVATVYNDSNAENNRAESYSITVRSLEVDAWYLWYPYWTVYKNETFWLFTYVNSTAYVCGAKVTVRLPHGLEVYNYSSSQWDSSYTAVLCLYEGKWNYIGFWARGVEVGRYGNGTQKEINVTIEVRGKSDTINTTASDGNFIPNYPLEVRVPTITLYSINSTSLDSNTTSASMTFKTLNVTTFAQNITIVVQAGQEGRILRGLDYLVHYPYGCVEQTTSAMLGALHTDEYYREKGFFNYDRNKINESVYRGVNRLAKGGEVGQLASGAWTMWGGDPNSYGGHITYSILASYGLGRVAEDAVFAYLVANNLTQESSYSNSVRGKFNFNDTVAWFRSQQKENGSWIGDYTYWFFGDDSATTGWIMVAHYQLANSGVLNETSLRLANESMINATKFLIGKQNSDGGWGNAISTALAVWGLKLYGMSENNKGKVEEAIRNGTNWLMSHYTTVSSNEIAWEGYMESPWYSGASVEATAYALIALNESRSMGGLNLSGSIFDSINETIRKAVNYLVGVYQASGSFGSTKVTQAAIHALTLLQVIEAQDTTVTITIDNSVVKTISVNTTNPMVILRLNDSEIEQINRLGQEQDKRRIHTVNIAKGSGFVVVSVENEQTVARDELTGSEYYGNRILRVVDSSPFARSADSRVLDKGQNLGIEILVPDGMVENGTYTLGIKISNNNATALISPIVRVHLSGAKFNASLAEWFDSQLGKFSFSSTTMNVIDDYTVELFPEQVPPNGYINITFNADVETSSANVTVDVSVTPMYAETQTYVGSATSSVKGYGNLTMNVYNVTGMTVKADVYVDNSKASESIKVVEGNHIVRVEKKDHVPIEFTVNLSRGDNITYTFILAKPEELETPKVLLARALNFTELENMLSLTGNVSVAPNATVRAAKNFSVSVSGGESIIAVKVPKLVRGSLWAWLNDSITVTVNGQNTGYREIPVGDERVLLINVAGNADVNISFMGRKLGAVDPSDDSISMSDIQAIARYMLEKDYNIDRKPQWTSVLWGLSE